MRYRYGIGAEAHAFQRLLSDALMTRPVATWELATELLT
jgi:hypothetical protein